MSPSVIARAFAALPVLLKSHGPVIASVALAIAFFVMDWKLPLGVAGGVPYVAVILIAARMKDQRFAIYLAVVCSALTIVGYLISPAGGEAWIVAANRGLALFAIWTTALLVASAKQSAVRMYRSEHRIRNAMDHIFGFVGFCGLDGKLMEANKAPLEAAGLAPEDVLGKPFWDTYWWNYSPAVQKQLKEALTAAARGETVRYDAVVRVGPVSFITIDVTFGPLRNEDGEVEQLIGFGVDVSERKKAEEAIRVAEARLSGILKISPEAVIAVDGGHRILLFSQGAEAIFGYTAEEIMGQSLDILLPAAVRDVHHTHLEGFARSPDVSRLMDVRGEVTALRKNGQEFPAFASISKLKQGGQLVFTVTMRDATDHKHNMQQLIDAKNEAEIANRTKSEFLANMSHELRTPLNAMIGFAEFINDEPFGPVGNPRYRDYLKDIHSSGQHLLSLINDILDMSKVESGNAELHQEDIDVSTVIQSCLRMMNERACKNCVELVADVADPQPALRADSRMVKQIVINLLSNAVKFTPAGGKVTVKVWHNPDSGHVLQVVDTGIGIALEKIPNALARFGQVDSGLARKFEGTGLGLPLTKSLIELHGGSLDLQSEVGVGTTVTVRFPAERAVRSQRGVKTLDTVDRAAS